MNITKSGIFKSPSINESSGANILLNSEKYTQATPYVVSGTSMDIYQETDMYNRVTPGETYYLTCKTNAPWATDHLGDKGTVTIWLYLLKTFNASNTSYDSPICFVYGASNNIANGVWKYTIPSGYNMARIRYNTYSNGTDSVTVKFWDTFLIPAKYYVPENPTSGVPSFHLGKDYISAREIYEL